MFLAGPLEVAVECVGIHPLTAPEGPVGYNHKILLEYIVWPNSLELHGLGPCCKRLLYGIWIPNVLFNAQASDVRRNASSSSSSLENKVTYVHA